jgi:phosphoenolpyruvate synthase/pyruvate phosphate dikinase
MGKTKLSKLLLKNKVQANSLVFLDKMFSREKSLMYMKMWDVSEKRGYKKFISYDLKNSFFIFDAKTKKTSVWYSNNETKTIKDILFRKIAGNKKFVSKIIECLDANWEIIWPYLLGKKKIKTVIEFKKYYQGLTNWWSAMNTAYPFINNPDVSKKAGHIFLKYRERSEKYTGKMDLLIMNFWTDALDRKYKVFIPYLLVDEAIILLAQKNVRNLITDIKKRMNGFGLFQGKIYPNSLIKKKIKKNNLIFNKIGKKDFYKIIGSSAYPGVVTGIVRRIIIKSDINNFKKGEILVAETTYPDHVPAMKKAAAFITDEGGITCHAAITAREFKKPCIVGTKFATQVLSNGDLIEVDANNGVVKVLSRRKSVKLEKTKSKRLNTIFKKINNSREKFISHLKKSKKWISTNERDICLLMRDLILNGEKSTIFNEALGANILPIGDAMVRNRLFSPVESTENVELALKNLSHKYGFKKLIEISRTCSKRAKKLHQYLETKNNNDLVQNLSEIKKLYTRVTCYLLILVFSEKFLEAQVKKMVRDKTGKENDYYFKGIVYVRKFNESSKELIAILELSKLIKIKKININSRLANSLFKKHLDQFGWISARYHFEEVWTIEQIKLRVARYLKENIKQKIAGIIAPRKEAEAITKEFISQFKLNKQEKQLIALVKEFVFLRTFRTESLVKANFLMKPFLKIAARKLNITEKDLLFLSLDEIVASINQEINYKNIIGLRKKGYYIILDNDVIKIFAGSDRKLIDSLNIFNIDNGGSQDIKGQIAWQGVARGTVKIVKNQIDIAKVKSGDILVAVMTFPNYIAAMEKAVAFVTDEGGILCHAAIIAREMKKPCIIATKNATKFLHDNDEIEVDANRGTVKVIRRK